MPAEPTTRPSPRCHWCAVATANLRAATGDPTAESACTQHGNYGRSQADEDRGTDAVRADWERSVYERADDDDRARGEL